MKKASAISVLACAALCFSFLACSHSRAPTDLGNDSKAATGALSVAQTEAAPPAQTGDVIESTKVGVVTMVDGQVQFKTSAGDVWKNAEIGDEIPVMGVVRTEEAASCELQFGNTGIVHIAAESLIEMRAIDISQDRRAVELSLLSGAIISKVDKLLGLHDRFMIRTETASCAVRGTRFLVRRATDSSITVAVSEGSVALIPASYDAAHFEVMATTGAPDAKKEEIAGTLAHGLLYGSPLVEPGQEATVTKSSLESIDKVLARAIAATDSGDNAALSKALDDYRTAAGGSRSPVGAVDKVSQDILQKASGLSILDSLPKKGEQIPAKKVNEASPAALSSLHLSIQVDPPDSLVLVDGKEKGRGNTDIELASGSDASLVIRHRGYEDYREDIAAGKNLADPAVRRLRLKPLAIYGTTTVSRNALVGGLAAADGRLYAADSKAQVFSFDREGKVYWSVDSKNGSNENSSPLVQSGILLFAGGKNLSLYDATSGEARSSFELGKSDSGLFGRRPLLLGNKALMSSETGLAVFDPSGKEAASAAALPEASDASLSIFGEDALVLTRGGILCVVDGSNLAVKAQIRTGTTQPIATRPIVRGGLAYLVDRKGLVSCVDLAAKKLLWEKRLEAGKPVEAFCDPLVTETGVYIFASSTLYGLSPDTGESLFPPIPGVESSAVEGDGQLWVGLGEKTIAVLDPKTGAKNRTIKIGATVTASPVADGDLLAFPLADGSVVFVNPEYRP